LVLGNLLAFPEGKFLGNENIGVVKQGAVADLILLDQNPLKNIKALDGIAGVMLNGRWVPKAEIQLILKGLERK